MIVKEVMKINVFLGILKVDEIVWFKINLRVRRRKKERRKKKNLSLFLRFIESMRFFINSSYIFFIFNMWANYKCSEKCNKKKKFAICVLFYSKQIKSYFKFYFLFKHLIIAY